MHPFNFCEHSTCQRVVSGKTLSHIPSFAALFARIRWGLLLVSPRGFSLLSA